MLHVNLRTPSRSIRPAPMLLSVGGLVSLALLAAVAVARPGDEPFARAESHDEAATLPRLAPARAAALEVDTLVLGGFTRGGFSDALSSLASDMGPSERAAVANHLGRIFEAQLGDAGMGSRGRLRVVYRRTSRPDGTARGVQVLAAEAAVDGTLHTALFHEHEGTPGYYDRWGRSLDPEPWAHPLPDARVSSPFGRHRHHPVLNRRLPHLGIDYAAPAGTPVRASADGHVVFAARRGGYGKMVELRHPNGYQTRYAHLSGFASGIEPGALVRRNERIGYVGSTGMATGPHLHYELRRGEVAVNPASASKDAVADLGFNAAWRAQRDRMGSLLAGTPTVVSRSDGR